MASVESGDQQQRITLAVAMLKAGISPEDALKATGVVVDGTADLTVKHDPTPIGMEGATNG